MDLHPRRFFANVTHELRTPLTTMIGPLEDWLSTAEGGRPDASRGPIALALASSRRLHGLVDQLLSFARIESGESPWDPVLDDLGRWLHQVWERFLPLARSRRFEYELLGPREPLPAEFDPRQLDFLVSNLIANAFKFTPDGGSVTVELAVPDDDTGFLTLSVSDTGCGIAPEFHELVFERFFQSSETHVRGQAGTGIGLALVREIAELHGGAIEVASQPGAGSRFTARLPMEPGTDSHAPVRLRHVDFRNASWTADAGAEPATDDAPREPDDRFTILVVEDSPEVLEYVTDGLSRRYRVLEAASGNQGLALARSAQPDLVVCDVMMADGTGLDLLRGLRAHPEICSTPVILLTAKAEARDAVVGLEAGANDYVTKPFHMQELEARVGSQIEAQHRLYNRLRLEQLRARSEVPEHPAGDEFLERIRGIVASHLCEPDLDVETLARALYMSRAKLYRKLEAEGLGAPGTLIRTLRLEAASRLLAEGAGSVAEVAYAVGFSSRSHFSRCFREHYGASPSERLPRGC